MGLDLTLKVLTNGEGTHCTVDLDLDRSYDFFQMFGNTYRREQQPICNPKKLQPQEYIYLYMDEGIEIIKVDAYGAPLTYITANEVKLIPAEVKEKLSPLNRAALAYIWELPDDTKIYLYWY